MTPGLGLNYVSINSDGLRDREHSLAHPQNTLRIAVLGDSFAEAMQVNQDETFWAVMEKDLQGCPNLHGRRVEAINFGQSGFGTAEELLVLHDRRTRERWQEEQKERSWGEKFYLWRRDHFRIFQVLHQGQKAIKIWWSQPHKTGEASTAPHTSEAGLSDSMYREPVNPVWQEAWKVTEAFLIRMRDEVAAKGARFFVVLVSTGARLIPIPQPELRLPRGSG
jgi:hypothetical protein